MTGRIGGPPSALDIADLDAPLVAAFLDHLQTDRGNTIATRNNRLAAIHSLFAYLALHHPEHADTIHRVLAIPTKRTDKNLLTHLTDPEVDALLAACDQAAWTGRRDHAMLALTIQTGLRISELIALDCQHITLGTGANVHDRQRTQGETNAPDPDHPNRAQSMARRARRRPRRAAVHDPHRHTTQPRRRRAPPRDPPPSRRQRLPLAQHQAHQMHTLRHTAAMRLLLAGNDITMIALWLGHQQISTTNIYLHADMTHKQKAIDRTRPLNAKPGRYQPTDTLLAFLQAL